MSDNGDYDFYSDPEIENDDANALFKLEDHIDFILNP